MATTDKTRVTTGIVRLSFVHLGKPYSSSPDVPARYSCALLVPKSDSTTIFALRDAQKAALARGVERGTFQGGVPKDWHDTIKDGDESDREEEHGHWVLNVSSPADRRPAVVDRNVNLISDDDLPTRAYSGVYARVALGAFAYNRSGNRGVSFGLNHVQIARDGEPLGGSATSPLSVFSPLSDEDEDLLS